MSRVKRHRSIISFSIPEFNSKGVNGCQHEGKAIKAASLMRALNLEFYSRV